MGVHIGKQIVKGLVQNKDTEKPLKASNTIFLLISYEGVKLLANQIRNIVNTSIAITLLSKSKYCQLWFTAMAFVRKCPVIKIRVMILIRKQQFGLFVNEKLQRNSEDFASDLFDVFQSTTRVILWDHNFISCPSWFCRWRRSGAEWGENKESI